MNTIKKLVVAFFIGFTSLAGVWAGLESATYINGLVTTNPTSGDPKAQGDDHLRLLKSTIRASFPNITGAMTTTQTDLNYLGVRSVATDGYQKLPGGLILQWGTSGALNAAASVSDNLALACPTAILSVTATPIGGAASASAAGVSASASLTAVTFYNLGSSISFTSGVRYMVVCH